MGATGATASAAGRRADWAAALRHVHDSARRTLSAWECAASDAPLAARCVVPVPPVDPFAWLAAQPHAVRLLWRGREDARVLAAVGVADVLEADAAAPFAIVDTAARACAHAPDMRYFGGFRFDPVAAVSREWQPYAVGRLALPLLTMECDGADAQLACNLVRRPGCAGTDRAALEEAFARFIPPDGADAPHLATLVGRCDAPGETAWLGLVRAVLDRIAAGAVEKLVLARRAVFSFDGDVDAAALLHRLRPLTAQCFHFCFQWQAGAAFMGTTPERLYRREGSRLDTEALAGTRPRGADPTRDAALAAELIASAKEQREHGLVRQAIRERLTPLCRWIEAQEEAGLVRLERKQHLYSRFAAGVQPGVDDQALLRALHPTPAVGGYPVADACAHLRGLEPFDRGWYAGPVGWVGHDAAEFAVAIRSGLVRGDTVSVYSGAGIVAGSDPAGEWSEVENKIADFVRVTTGR